MCEILTLISHLDFFLFKIISWSFMPETTIRRKFFYMQYHIYIILIKHYHTSYELVLYYEYFYIFLNPFEDMLNTNKIINKNIQTYKPQLP